MQVKFVQATPNPEENMAYIARVSNPQNQENPSFEGLLKYCVKHQHWSVFEQSFMTLEIETNRGIAAQILRHRSFTFQEFSQRYADANLLDNKIPVPDLRRQDLKNRQNSIDDLSTEARAFLQGRIAQYFAEGMDLYNQLVSEGVAKECARFVLPLATPTRIYMSGSCRSWIHYINLRTANGTQKEHMDIAEECKRIFICKFPTVAKALDWSCPDGDCGCESIQPSLRID